MLLDTHAHLADPVFDPDLIRVIERAKEAGVSAIIAVSENLKEARRNLKLAEKHPAILPAAGLYPGNLDMQQAQEMVSFIRRKRDRLVAIGEVGLDRWIVKEESDRELQQEIFCMFIDLSLELDLPLNIHSRSAGRHVIALLLGRGANKVQLHANPPRPSRLWKRATSFRSHLRWCAHAKNRSSSALSHSPACWWKRTARFWALIRRSGMNQLTLTLR